MLCALSGSQGRPGSSVVFAPVRPSIAAALSPALLALSNQELGSTLHTWCCGWGQDVVSGGEEPLSVTFPAWAQPCTALLHAQSQLEHCQSHCRSHCPYPAASGHLVCWLHASSICPVLVVILAYILIPANPLPGPPPASCAHPGPVPGHRSSVCSHFHSSRRVLGALLAGGVWEELWTVHCVAVCLSPRDFGSTGGAVCPPAARSHPLCRAWWVAAAVTGLGLPCCSRTGSVQPSHAPDLPLQGGVTVRFGFCFVCLFASRRKRRRKMITLLKPYLAAWRTWGWEPLALWSQHVLCPERALLLPSYCAAVWGNPQMAGRSQEGLETSPQLASRLSWAKPNPCCCGPATQDSPCACPCPCPSTACQARGLLAPLPQSAVTATPASCPALNLHKLPEAAPCLGRGPGALRSAHCQSPPHGC